jgi:hypothetical protein
MKKLLLTTDLSSSYKRVIANQPLFMEQWQITHANDHLLHRSNAFVQSLHIARFSYDLILTKNLNLRERVKDLTILTKIIVLPGNMSFNVFKEIFSDRDLQIANFIKDDSSILSLRNTKEISISWY